MTNPIRRHAPVTLVGAGPVTPAQFQLAHTRAPDVIAADGGAITVRDFGSLPSAIIGDMDSIGSLESWHNSGTAVLHVAEQESTDFEKCLLHVEAPLYLAVGFSGGRIDHTLAAIASLIKHRDRSVVMIGREDVVFACPAHLRLDLAPGTRVSLFPMAQVRGVSSRGLEWPLDGLDLAPAGRIGTSNRATGPVEVAFDAPGTVVLLPVACLDQAIAAVSTPAR